MTANTRKQALRSCAPTPTTPLCIRSEPPPIASKPLQVSPGKETQSSVVVSNSIPELKLDKLVAAQKHVQNNTVVLGYVSAVLALVALACLSSPLYSPLSRGELLARGLARKGAPGTVATRLLRSQALDGAFVDQLVRGIRRDVKHVERDGSRLQAAGAGGGPVLPSMRQVLKMRQKRREKGERERTRYQNELGASFVNCRGKSADECELGLDSETLQHIFKMPARQAELLQLNRFQASARDLEKRMGGASAKIGSTSLTALERQESDLAKQNKLEVKINMLLKNNAKLAQQNAVLSTGKAKDVHQLHTQLHVQLDSSVLGNPAGILEPVPATVSAGLPGVPDFNGASGVVARLPAGLGFAPSLLDANGVEERGSFTLRKANPYGGIWIRAYGKMNHPIKCTLKSYRKLGGMFMGQTVYTGYKKAWSGKTSISTGIIPPGSSNTFDIITCRDMQTGEVQHFRTYPTPSPGSFADPGDPEFQDEYTSHAITPDHP